jgi:hypothetical protein
MYLALSLDFSGSCLGFWYLNLVTGNVYLIIEDPIFLIGRRIMNHLRGVMSFNIAVSSFAWKE